jgi:hypothetical protein
MVEFDEKKGILILLLAAVYALASCDAGKKKRHYESPAHYSFDTPKKYIMPESLLEISGIAFSNVTSDTIYAIADELGELYAMTPGNKATLKYKFGKKGDYEDVSIFNKHAYILKSNGSVYAFPLSAQSPKEMTTVIIDEVLPKGDYESMFIDSKGALYILNKAFKEDTEKEIKGFVFEKDSAWVLKTDFTVETDTINIKHFQPSALAKHPLTSEWYIISSVHKKLLITDSDWRAKQVIALNPQVFHQPEGIAFDAQGNLFISNEGDEILNGNILRFDFIK